MRPNPALMRTVDLRRTAAQLSRPLGVIRTSRYTERMSKADRLKEEIGWLKVAFAIAGS